MLYIESVEASVLAASPGIVGPIDSPSRYYPEEMMETCQAAEIFKGNIFTIENFLKVLP